MITEITYDYTKIEAIIGPYQGHDDFLYGFYVIMTATDGINIVSAKRNLELNLSEEVYKPFAEYTKEEILEKVNSLVDKYDVKSYLDRQLNILIHQPKNVNIEL